MVRFASLVAFGLAAGISVLRACQLIGRPVYEAEIAADIVKYLRRLRSDAASAFVVAFTGMIGVVAVVFVGSVTVVLLLSFMLSSVTAATLVTGLVSHSRTSRDLQRAFTTTPPIAAPPGP